MLGAGLLVVADVPGLDPDARMLDLHSTRPGSFVTSRAASASPAGLDLEKLVKIGETLARPVPLRPKANSLRLEALIGELQSVMEQTSICGLGTSASKPLASLLAYDWNRTRASKASLTRAGPGER